MCICAGILFLFEGILRVRYNDIPITHEFFLTAQDRVLSPEYIFEQTQSPEPRTDDRFHIAIIGDSFSACDMFITQECYPQILEAMLAHNGKKIHIQSYGMGGNNADMELRYFIDKILPTRPDLVIWQLYANDVWENVLFPVYIISDDHRLVPYSGRENWAYKRQVFFNTIPMNRMALQSFVMRWILRLFEYKSYDQSPYGNDEGRVVWGLEKIRLGIEEMNRLSHEYGFKVLYVQIPTQSIYLTQAYSPQYQWQYEYNIRVYNELHTILEKQEGYVPLAFTSVPSSEGNVLGAASLSVADRYYLHEDDANFLGDKHLNQEGNQVVAEQLMKRIHLLMQDGLQ